jgi:hypothetical protein
VKRLILIIAICTGVLWGGPVGADEAFDRAYEAYKRGDYTEAAEGLRVLAEKGNASAQAGLGSMYWHPGGGASDETGALPLAAHRPVIEKLRRAVRIFHTWRARRGPLP